MLLSCLILGLATPSFSYPAECPKMEPSTCADPSDVKCDNGQDANGCWMGDYCLPMNNQCPMPCAPIQPSNCSSTEVVCDRGMTGACWNGDYCMPAGSECPLACNTPPPSICASSDMRCPFQTLEHYHQYCLLYHREKEKLRKS